MASGTIRLRNTLGGALEPLRDPGRPIRLYVCGVTPYDTAHLGHAFTYVSFDVLVRHLKRRGYALRYVQNVTDVDDPLFERARQTGVPWDALSQAQAEQHFAAMARIRVAPPDVVPWVSREIPAIQEMIAALLDAGHAYPSDGQVYYRRASFASFGALSGYSEAQMLAIARERGGNPDDPLKEDPLDFVLWQRSAADEPAWESPWGPGRPGWHIECSAMARRYLGEQLDIHGGGHDLIFPHHECERAQSEAANGVPFVRHWLHTRMVYMDGQKMSKSLGNMVFVRDLLREYTPNAIRLYLSSCHYRETLHWDPRAMSAAQARADKLAAAARLVEGPVGLESPGTTTRSQRILAALDDDLNTPLAIQLLEEWAQTRLALGQSDAADTAAYLESAEALG